MLFEHNFAPKTFSAMSVSNEPTSGNNLSGLAFLFVLKGVNYFEQIFLSLENPFLCRGFVLLGNFYIYFDNLLTFYWLFVFYYYSSLLQFYCVSSLAFFYRAFVRCLFFKMRVPPPALIYS